LTNQSIVDNKYLAGLKIQRSRLLKKLSMSLRW